MTNLEAIKILDNLKPGDYSNPYEKGEAILMAISALQEQEAKAQLSAEGTTSDLISRQDAIDALEKTKTVISEIGERYVAKINAQQNIALLPSAQPEIIRCKDCKRWLREYLDINGKHGCNVMREYTAPNDYCYKAERKE